MAYWFIKAGESNAGGRAQNIELAINELVPRDRLQIWNSVASAVQALWIGVNNLLAHAGITPPSAAHGWEVEIANSIDAGEWGPGTHYLTECCQGGSNIGQWNEGQPYWTNAVASINAMQAHFAGLGISPQPVVLLSIGINDTELGTSVSTFKAGLVAMINRYKVLLPTAVFVMTELPANRLNPANQSQTFDYAAYTAAINEIADSEDRVTIAAAVDQPTYDGQHWGVAETRIISRRMQGHARALLGIADEITWSHRLGYMMYSARRLKSTVSSGSGYGFTSKSPIQFADGAEIIWDVPYASGVALVLETTKKTTYTWTGSTFVAGAYRNGNNVHRAVGNQTSGTAVIGTNQRYIRLRRVGDNLEISASNDAQTWTVLGNAGTNVLAGQTQYYIRVMNGTTTLNNALSIWMPRFRLVPPTNAISGRVTQINWIDYRSSTYNVQLSLDGGTTWTTLAASIAAKTYAWIPTDSQLSSEARIRVVDAAVPSRVVMSDAIRVLSASTISLDAVYQLITTANATIQANLDRPVSETATPEDVAIDVSEVILSDSSLNSIASKVWTFADRIISGFASTAISQLTNKIGPAIGYSPVDKDGNINLVCGDDYAAVDGRAIVLTHKVSNPDIDITGATVTLYYSKPTSEDVGTLTGVVHVPTGRVAVKFEPTKLQTATIVPDYYAFVVVVSKDGRDLTTFEGKLTMTKYRLPA